MTLDTSRPLRHANRSGLRTVAVIGHYAHYYVHGTIDGLGNFDVVFIESIAHAYSKIKRVGPDVVVVCVSEHDVDACHVLSMLALDGETSRIPVLTYLIPAPPPPRDDAERDPELPSRCGFDRALN
jgi:hypothetical protein